LHWLFPLEEYVVTFENISGEKNLVANASFHLDIDSLKIKNRKALKLLPGSKNSIIR
jgi:hypothetical protein